MHWVLVQLVIFLSSVCQISSNLKERMAVTRKTGSSVVINCDLLQIYASYLHWYQFQEGKAPRHLLYQNVYSSDKVKVNSGNIQGKYQAYKIAEDSYVLELQSLEESDSGVYSCAIWTSFEGNYYTKHFSRGTKLIVTDRTLNTDLSPKPTMFLPSVAETNLHDAGTHLCLLEKFFPDEIYVHWKEKNGKTILESQQGKTMKINDTYMKFSWLTVSGNSLNKEHQCIVKHENNKGGVDQEILFPPIRKAVVALDPTEAPLTEQEQLSRQLFREALQLQLTSTSAYYTYLLLLLKSAAYSAVITFCVFRRAALCGTGKSSLQTEA